MNKTEINVVQTTYLEDGSCTVLMDGELTTYTKEEVAEAKRDVEDAILRVKGGLLKNDHRPD